MLTYQPFLGLTEDPTVIHWGDTRGLESIRVSCVVAWSP